MSGDSPELGYCLTHADRAAAADCDQCGAAMCTDCIRPVRLEILCPTCAARDALKEPLPQASAAMSFLQPMTRPTPSIAVPTVAGPAVPPPSQPTPAPIPVRRDQSLEVPAAHPDPPQPEPSRRLPEGWFDPDTGPALHPDPSPRVALPRFPPTPAPPSGPNSPVGAAAQPGDRLGSSATSLRDLALYCVGFFVVVLLLSMLLELPLVLAHRAANGGSATEPRDLLHPGKLSPALWSALQALSQWGQFGGVLLFTYLFGRKRAGFDLKSIGFDPARFRLSDVGYGLMLAAILFLWLLGLGSIAGWYSVAPASSPVEGLTILWVGFLILLPAAALEEVVVRGMIGNLLARKYGAAVAVLGSSGLFAALHMLNPGFSSHPFAFLGIFLAGIYLSMAYLATRNLWLAIFLHTGWNLLEGPVFGLPVSGLQIPFTVFQTTALGPAALTGGEFGPEAGLLLCGVVIAQMALYFYFRDALAPRPELSPESDPGTRDWRGAAAP